MAAEGSNQLHLRNCLNCVVVQNTVQALLLYSWKKKMYRKTLKNCTLISHFASASGRLRPQTPYRGFALDHTGEGTQGSPPDPLASPFLNNPWCTPCEVHTVNPLHFEIVGMPMVKPIPITIPSRLLAVAPPDILHGVMWGHPILDIIRHVICPKYCHNFLIKRRQCRHNCCHHEPYFTLICTKSSVGWGSAQTPLGELTAPLAPLLDLRVPILLRGGEGRGYDGKG